MDEALRALETLAPVVALRTSLVAYLIISALHILGIALLIGSILVVDISQIGLWRGSIAESLNQTLTPIAIAGFCLTAATGFCLFAVRGSHYAANEAWQLKMGLIAAALLNACFFHRIDRLNLSRNRVFLQISSAVSILLWIGVLVSGRFIAFVGE